MHLLRKAENLTEAYRLLDPNRPEVPEPWWLPPAVSAEQSF